MSDDYIDDVGAGLKAQPTRYNGEGYKANRYDTRLAAAYQKAVKERW